MKIHPPTPRPFSGYFLKARFCVAAVFVSFFLLMVNIYILFWQRVDMIPTEKSLGIWSLRG